MKPTYKQTAVFLRSCGKEVEAHPPGCQLWWYRMLAEGMVSPRAEQPTWPPARPRVSGSLALSSWLWLFPDPALGTKWPKASSAAAAAKSLQCDPIDVSPPGSPVPGILQARTLQWVAISFSNAWKWKVKVKSLSRVWLLATPWTTAYQDPPSVGFSRQEYWSGVPLPSLKLSSVQRKRQGSLASHSLFIQFLHARRRGGQCSICEGLTLELWRRQWHPTLAWKIPWMEEPGRLQSMGSLGVGHDWATSLSLFTFHFHALEKEMATHSGVLAWRIPGRGAWWAAIYGVAQSQTWLKRLSSSSSSSHLFLLFV